MENAEDHTKAAIQQLVQIANKYSRIEKLPIRVDEGVTATTREVHTLQAIGEHEQMCVTDVASHFGVTKSAASQLVARLSRKGFLEKSHAAHNNKELQLALTPLGWKAFHAHERFHGEDLARILACLEEFSGEQLAVLSVLLEAIGSVMDERLCQE